MRKTISNTKVQKYKNKSNIYRNVKKAEKHKELEYKTFNQVIENLLISGTLSQRLTTTYGISRMTILLLIVLAILLYCG